MFSMSLLLSCQNCILSWKSYVSPQFKPDSTANISSESITVCSLAINRRLKPRFFGLLYDGYAKSSWLRDMSSFFCTHFNGRNINLMLKQIASKFMQELTRLAPSPVTQALIAWRRERMQIDGGTFKIHNVPWSCCLTGITTVSISI